MITRFRADLSALPLTEKPVMEKLGTLLRSRIEERCGARREESRDAYCLSFRLEEGLPREGYRIAEAPNGLVISGGDFPALAYGLGRFLHSARYTETGFEPGAFRGISAPDCPFRVIYFAIHFYNWYYNTDAGELERYLEDMLLWGYNGVAGILAKANLEGPDDPNTEIALQRLEKLYAAARRLEMLTVFQFGNPDFRKSDPALAADKSGIHCKTGNLICPGKPAGYAYIRDLEVSLVKRLAKTGVDMISYFPYDEGGCSCRLCAPWGGNGYYRMARELHKEFRRFLPEVKAMLSCWHFNVGINDPRDFPWLDRAIREDRERGLDWVDYVMVDCRNGVPPYVREHGVPGGCRGVDFPEISMYELRPWGAFGANPLPKTFERIWRDCADIVQGGMPYSEGKYEDINKVLYAGFFWDKGRSAEDILKDYAGYEFPGASAEEVIRLTELIEENHLRTGKKRLEKPEPELYAEAEALGRKLDGELLPCVRGSWRWRILYLRSKLDALRYRSGEGKAWPAEELKTKLSSYGYWGVGLERDEEAQAAFRELVEIFEMPEEFDPRKHFGHHMLRPLLSLGSTEADAARTELAELLRTDPQALDR